MSEGRVATIDADGHVIEPADLWERELPPSLRARGFHIRWDAETEQEQEQVWEDWDRTIAVNLRGPFLCAKHALPHLVRRGGGVIINVSSHGAFQASPTGIADYAVAKGGLVTLTYYLASEYGADNVRANCIAPGPVPTDDVAWAAVFLASDEARWITGAVLRVDGGIVVQ